MMKLYNILFAILVFSGCTDIPKVAPLNIDDIKWDIEYKIDHSFLESDLLIPYPASMFLTDSLIVVQDHQGTKSFFYVMDRFTGNLLSSFATLGHGQKEVLNASNNYTLSKNCDTISIYDDKNRQLYEYILLNNQFVFLKKESLGNREEQNKVWIKEYFKIDEDISFSMGLNGIFDKNRFLIFEKERSIITGDYPNLSLYLDKSDKLVDIFYGPSFFKLNKLRQKAVFGTYKGGLMQIFDLSELPNQISIDTTLLLCSPYEGEADNRINRYGFEDIFTTNNYIYTLYNGKTNIENNYFAKDILIFNWDGTPKIKLHSEIYLKCFCIDEKSMEIFAVAYDPEKTFCLVKFNIKNLL